MDLQLSYSYPSANGPSMHETEAKRKIIEGTNNHKKQSTTGKHAMNYKCRLFYHESYIAQGMKPHSAQSDTTMNFL
jgi:hypothetical protein